MEIKDKFLNFFRIKNSYNKYGEKQGLWEEKDSYYYTYRDKNYEHRIRKEGIYKEGRKFGLWKEREKIEGDKEEEIYKEAYYRNNKKEGLYKKIIKSNGIENYVEGNFKNGEPVGHWVYKKNNKITRTKDYFEEKEFYEILKKEYFDNIIDDKDSENALKYDEKEILIEKEYKDEKVFKEEIYVKNIEPEGDYYNKIINREYYESGQLMLEEKYNIYCNRLKGVINYSSKGEKEKVEKYKEGELAETIFFKNGEILKKEIAEPKIKEKDPLLEIFEKNKETVYCDPLNDKKLVLPPEEENKLKDKKFDSLAWIKQEDIVKNNIKIKENQMPVMLKIFDFEDLKEEAVNYYNIKQLNIPQEIFDKYKIEKYEDKISKNIKNENGKFLFETSNIEKKKMRLRGRCNKENSR